MLANDPDLDHRFSRGPVAHPLSVDRNERTQRNAGESTHPEAPVGG
jgi:hypothetical protein